VPHEQTSRLYRGGVVERLGGMWVAGGFGNRVGRRRKSILGRDDTNLRRDAVGEKIRLPSLGRTR
jgi:hypothetical protein